MASNPFLPSTRSFLADPIFDLHREMNRLFGDAMRGGGVGSSGTMPLPQIDVHESDGELCISADLPGLSREDVDLRLEGDLLTISGERKQEQSRQQRGYHVMERSHGRFRRSVQLGFAPDPSQVDARFEHGVLTIKVPRKSEQERVRRIPIQGGEGASIGGSAGGPAVDRTIEMEAAGSSALQASGIGASGGAAGAGGSGASEPRESTASDGTDGSNGSVPGGAAADNGLASGSDVAGAPSERSGSADPSGGSSASAASSANATGG
jgi:HSP20 family protein